MYEVQHNILVYDRYGVIRRLCRGEQHPEGTPTQLYAAGPVDARRSRVDPRTLRRLRDYTGLRRPT
jgi:hypothetical protein